MNVLVKLLTFALAFSFVLGCYHQEKSADPLTWNKGPVTNEASGTAQWCAFLRALAATETREGFKGPDQLAEIFLPEGFRKALRDPVMRRELIWRQAQGMYAYITARTYFMDQATEQALRENIPQIVIMGTGYDSRPYRFQHLAKDTKFFELDTRPTLEEKKERLRQAGISIPANVIFVPIDFTKDSFEDVFAKAGYDKNKKTLFLWEGVVYYIGPQAVDTTLRFIKDNAPAGSTVCFDYTASATAAGGNDPSSLVSLSLTMANVFPNEPSGQWLIEYYEIPSYLEVRGFRINEHLRATKRDIDMKYSNFSATANIGSVPYIFGLVQASVVP